MPLDDSTRARILAIYKDAGPGGASMSELVHRFGDDAPSRAELRRSLKALCRVGELVRMERDLYAIAPRGGEFEGVLRYENNRFRVRGPDGDVEIPASSVHDAIANDLVRGRLTSQGGPPVGVVDDVTEARAPREFAVQVSRYRGLFIGESEEIAEPVQIVGRLPSSVRPGSFVRVEVVDRRPFMRGRAAGFPSHVLAVKHPDAEVGRHRQTDKARMLRFVDPESVNAREVLDQLARGLGVDAPFPEAAVAQATAGRPPERADEYGDDLTGLALVTIDGADAKDFDDAVFAEELDGGRIRLWVAIADVSSYVVHGSELDEEARRRGCSVYLPGRVYPMLPSHLSDDVCSLRPAQLRRCAWVQMDMTPTGKIDSYEVGFGVMRSRARLTYREYHEFLDGGPADWDDTVCSSLRLLDEVRSRRWGYRRQRGMLDLDLPEADVQLSEDGSTVEGIEPSARWDANRVIEECMLAANETVAHFLLRAGWPTIYRVHGEPDDRKLAVLRQVLKDVARQARVPADPTPADLERILETVAGTDSSRVLSWLVLRTLPRAEYSVQRSDHYGLGTDLYLHFTSPIRRYPDLEVHRMVRNALEKGTAASTQEREVLVSRLTEAATASNTGEGVQTTAERTSDRMMRSLFMREHVGDRFTAIVSDVARFGLFVSVTHPYVEGLVPISALGDDYYELDERRARLVGERTRRSFQVGETIEVECVAVDVRQGNITFEPVGARGLRQSSRRGRPSKARRSGPKRRRR